MDLFSSPDISIEPLASRMRPRTLKDFVGQQHIVAPGRLLYRAIQADQLSSLIFYGPPGTGKTTLARVIANTTKRRFITLNAVLSGVKEVREVTAEAQKMRDLYNQRTILFVDEVHRWNKAQQDALLPWVENGTVTLIGATTANPYFEVNSALVSRSRIFQLKPLTAEDLFAVARLALTDKERGYGNYRIVFEPGALEHIVDIANGDARSLLNALELAVETTPAVFPPPEGEEIYISLETAEESIQKKVVLYDKEGDYHFDTISAFIKSIRGSDPDASLYWLAKMIRAGEDPRYIFRRMLISASEDVGLANPQALCVVEAAASAFDRVGLPEGNFHLAHAALYLATSPKSNSTLGFFDAVQAVEEEADQSIPNHLKDASRDKKGFGHGEGYLYPHAYRDHWVAQQYLPKGLQGKLFYTPSNEGWEAEIGNLVRKRRELQLASLSKEPEEILTFSPPDRKREQWLSRIIEGRSGMLADIRSELCSLVRIQRTARVLVLNAGDGILLWEALRQAPEGGVYGLIADPNDRETIEHAANRMAVTDRPVVLPYTLHTFSESGEYGELSFDTVLGRNALYREADKAAAFRMLYKCCAPSASLSLAEIIPSKAQRLSAYAAGGILDRSLLERFRHAEESVYSNAGNPLVNWNESDLKAAAEQAGFEVKDVFIREFVQNRILGEKDLETWFSPTGGSYGEGLIKALSPKEFSAVKEAVRKTVIGSPVPWRTYYGFLVCRRH